MDRPPPPGRLLVAGLSLVVPRRVRAAWRREWEGELAVADAATRRALLRGVAADAFATRRHARALAERRTAGRGAAGTTGGRGMGDRWRDVRLAARGLARSPGFTSAAVATLGVGLGAAAAIFTLVDALLLRPLPYPHADRLVVVHQTMTASGLDGREWPLTVHTYLFLAEQSRTLEAAGAHYAPAAATLTAPAGGGAPDAPAERVQRVDADVALLELLGARTVVGRLFDAGEDAPGAPPVAVLGHGLWERRYGGDRGVVGRSIELDGRGVRVVGVMAEDVHLPGSRVDVWTPAALDADRPVTDQFRLTMLGRRAPDRDVADVGAEMEALTTRLPELAPFFRMFLDDLGLRTRVRSLREEVVGDVARALWILLGGVGVLLVVAAANVANLFLVRAEGRRREVGIRCALGAGRRDVAALFLSESAVVSALAALLALGLAAAGVRVLVALAPPGLPRLEELRPGGATVAFLLALADACAAALGLHPWTRSGAGRARPAWSAARGDADVGDRRRGWTGSALVVTQVALALVLLSGAALLVRSFRELRAVDPGFRPAGVLHADLALPASGYGSVEEVAVFLERVRSRLEALPGVEAVASGPAPVRPPGTPELCSSVYVEGRAREEGGPPPCAPIVTAGARYWDVLGIRLTDGRAPTPAEVGERAPVAVVSANLAERLWPGESAVGRGIVPGPRRSAPFYRVVGVAEPVRSAGPDREPGEVLYLPTFLAFEDRWPFRSQTLLLRFAPGGDPVTVAAELRRAVAEVDRDVPVTVRGTLEQAVARTTVRTSFTLFLLGTAAATALVLGLVGLYGVVAYRVGRRRSEIGVRMALGADGRRVRALVLGHSLRLVGAGLALGLVGSALATRLLEGLLFGVRPGDPWMLGAAAAALLLTATAASWIPAARATRVDPARALRGE